MEVAKHQFHYIILFCHVAIMLNFKARALQIPDLLAKGCCADAVPALVWIRYSRIHPLAQGFQIGSGGTSVFQFSAYFYLPTVPLIS